MNVSSDSVIPVMKLEGTYRYHAAIMFQTLQGSVPWRMYWGIDCIMLTLETGQYSFSTNFVWSH